MDSEITFITRDIQLNFINRSNQVDPNIVIFQNSFSNSPTIAWLVIKNCGAREHHPFTYPVAMQVEVMDSDGNYMPRIDTQPGNSFAVTRDDAGDRFARGGTDPEPNFVHVTNELPEGTITANVYKDGRLIESQASLAPGATARFAFISMLWIGDLPVVAQGDVLDRATVETAETVGTFLPLDGLASADIVMTGGGSGATAKPLAFTLQNVVHA